MGENWKGVKRSQRELSMTENWGEEPFSFPMFFAAVLCVESNEPLQSKSAGRTPMYAHFTPIYNYLLDWALSLEFFARASGWQQLDKRELFQTRRLFVGDEYDKSLRMKSEKWAKFILQVRKLEVRSPSPQTDRGGSATTLTTPFFQSPDDSLVSQEEREKTFGAKLFSLSLFSILKLFLCFQKAPACSQRGIVHCFLRHSTWNFPLIMFRTLRINLK